MSSMPIYLLPALIEHHDIRELSITRVLHNFLDGESLHTTVLPVRSHKLANQADI